MVVNHVGKYVLETKGRVLVVKADNMHNPKGH